MAQHDLRQRIKAKLDALVDELMDSPHAPTTIEEIEEAALRLRDKAGRIVAQEMADEQAQQESAQQNKRACSCGRWARDKGLRSRQVLCLSGNLRLWRRYFYCRRCDRGFCPADERLGLAPGQGYTPRLVREVVRVSALVPYTCAVGLLFDLSGVSVSAKEAQRMSGAAATPAEQYLLQREQDTAAEGYCSDLAPDVLYVEADGVHTPLREGAEDGLVGSWREIKVGVVRALRANGVEMMPPRYVSYLGDAETFGRRWSALALECGALTARLVAVIGDGAAWIWRQAALQFPWAVRILDFFHVCEYLWECGRAAYGEGAAGAWVKARKDELLRSDLPAALAALKALAREHPSAAEAVTQTDRQKDRAGKAQRVGVHEPLKVFDGGR